MDDKNLEHLRIHEVRRPDLTVIEGGLSNVGGDCFVHFSGVELSHLYRSGLVDQGIARNRGKLYNFSPISPEVLALRGIADASKAPEIYKARQELSQDIQLCATLYIAYIANSQRNWPSISDYKYPDRAFYADKSPLVESAIDLGLLEEKPTPEELWSMTRTPVRHILLQRLPRDREKRDSMVSYLYKQGFDSEVLFPRNTQVIN